MMNSPCHPIAVAAALPTWELCARRDPCDLHHERWCLPMTSDGARLGSLLALLFDETNLRPDDEFIEGAVKH